MMPQFYILVVVPWNIGQRWSTRLLIKRLWIWSPGRNGGRVFFSRVNFQHWHLFWYLFHTRVTAVAVKQSNPSHSRCQTCRRHWHVTLTAEHMCVCIIYMCNLAPTKCVSWLCLHRATHQGNELTHNPSGKACPQLAQLAKPLRTDPCSWHNTFNRVKLVCASSTNLFLLILFFKWTQRKWFFQAFHIINWHNPYMDARRKPSPPCTVLVTSKSGRQTDKENIALK